jgi:4-carboxymuconolactone decarboxylase
MDDAQADRAAFDTAERLPGAPLVLPLGPGEPPSGADFQRLATRHTFGDSRTRTGTRPAKPGARLGDHRRDARRTRAVARPAADRPQQRVTKEEIVDLFIHLEAYAGAARAFDS